MRWRGIALGLLLVGCGPDTQAPTPPLPLATAIPGAEPRDPFSGFEWLSGRRANGTAWLQYSPDESDNVHMLFECRLRSGVVSAEAFDALGTGAQLILASSHARGVYVAEPIHDDTGEFFGDAVKSRARIFMADPVIAAFRQSGALSVGDPPVPFRAATLSELERIETFFEFCEVD